MKGRLPVWAALALLAILTIGTHWPRLFVGYVWDDNYLIAQNAALRANPFSAWGSATFQESQAAETYYYRPLPFFLLGLAGQAGGFETARALALLHLSLVLAAVGSVFVLFRRHFGTATAFALAALFAVFPTNVEAFAWLSAMPDLLALIFLVLFVLALDDTAQRAAPPAAALIWLALALLSKEGAVAALVIALAIDWPVLRHRPWERLGRFHLPLWLVGWAYLMLRATVVQSLPGFALRPSLFFGTLGAYAAKLLNPWPLSIIIGDRLDVWGMTAYGGIAVAAVLLAVLAFTRDRALRLGAALFTGGFLPYANIALPAGENYLIAERYMLPMLAGGLLALGVALGRLRRPAPALAALACLGTLYAFTSHQQYEVWRNPEAMWSQVLDSNPGKAGALFRRARIEAKQGRAAAAREDADEAVRLVTWWAERGVYYDDQMRSAIHHTAAVVAFEAGDFPRAVSESRLEFEITHDPLAAEIGINALDHSLDQAGSLAASLRANAAFPAYPTFATLAIGLAVTAEKPALAWQVVNRSSYRYAGFAAQLAKEYAATATYPAATRGMWIYTHTRLISPSFARFAGAVTGMSPQQRATVAQLAFKEHMYGMSDYYYQQALAAEPRAEWAVARGYALANLGREAEACAAWAGAGHAGDPELQNTLERLHEQCAH